MDKIKDKIERILLNENYPLDKILLLFQKERRDIIYILKQQKPICAGSCGSGCEYLVEKLIKELEKK